MNMLKSLKVQGGFKVRVAAFGEVLLRLATNKGLRISNSRELNINYGGAETNVLLV